MSPLSLNPSTFVEGGLLDDVDVTVKAAAFVMWDYQGAVSPAVPSLGLTMTDPDGKDHDQYFSCGDAKYFSPSKDDKTPADEGSYLIPIGDKKGLNNNTNAAKFLESLINAGFPADKLEAGNISVLVGLQFHMRREPVKRSGLIRTGKNANREQTVVTVAKIHKMPWEAAARPTGTAAAKPNGVGAAAPATASAENPRAAEVIMGVLLENDGKVPKAKLATLVWAALKGDPDQKAFSQLAVKDAYLSTIEGTTFKDGVLSLA